MSKSSAVTDLILETFRVNGRLLSTGDALIADLGLTSARWQVLGAVALSAVPLPVAHIARNMGLTRQAVQRLANEMERDGLVRFEPNPHHQRARLVALTRKGKGAFDIAMQRQGPWASSLAEGLTIQQVETATMILRTLRKHLEDQPEQEDTDD